jgi:AbrB family looped-hinge helix DNA binding protein
MRTQMPSKTKISEGYSTVVPSDIRKRLELAPGDILQWDIEDDSIRIRPRKKATLDRIIGIGACGGDAVSDKKKAQPGGP